MWANPATFSGLRKSPNHLAASSPLGEDRIKEEEETGEASK
jgi:hypothetical protein